MKMSCTIEKALADAKALVERLREHDSAAEALIEQTTALNKRVEAMKQYQEEIQELNEVARHRPRSTLVMGIQQENRQIRELQQENKELRTSLEEHQSALELIMSKYREQMFRLLMASKKDDPSIITKLKEQHSKVITSLKFFALFFLVNTLVCTGSIQSSLCVKFCAIVLMSPNFYNPLHVTQTGNCQLRKSTLPASHLLKLSTVTILLLHLLNLLLFHFKATVLLQCQRLVIVRLLD
ncbi:FGFR1 oncogene partner 2 [Oenanthe melanoleuca]|uniref:FGFR1 oncogene partner 2 n=1 Tax=Oenanthe melanoleuca TaxID=2939378 RepID=UPI0024C0E7CA|nr:FGFR1 oncogene partner 2 [Oenanthe melanoleuca]